MAQEQSWSDYVSGENLPRNPRAMRVTVPDSVSEATIVRDLNSLQPIPGTGDVISSCPNDDGSHYLLVFRYANGDQWTVDVQRQGCQRVTAGGFWPRLFASSNPQLMRDLDALHASLISP